MTCSDFLAQFSDFYDGDLSSDQRSVFLGHVDHCPTCSRYLRVVDSGVSLLKTLPRPKAKDDFKDRLRHSIYQLDEERRRGRNDAFGTSNFSFLAIVAVAALTMILIWKPFAGSSDPQVVLSPIVVEAPADSDALAREMVGTGATMPEGEIFTAADLWAESNILLFERSSLYQRHRESGLVRTGLQ